MAAERPKRTVQEINYQVFSTTGKKWATDTDNMAEHKIEEGQLMDNPVNVHHEDDGEFNSESVQSQTQEKQLDYDDTLLDEDNDEESSHKCPEKESVLSLDDKDIVQDELWEKQQEILLVNSEWHEQARKQLARRKELNKALLKQEEERCALAKMEQEVYQLEQKRSV